MPLAAAPVGRSVGRLVPDGGHHEQPGHPLPCVRQDHRREPQVRARATGSVEQPPPYAPNTSSLRRVCLRTHVDLDIGTASSRRSRNASTKPNTTRSPRRSSSTSYLQLVPTARGSQPVHMTNHQRSRRRIASSRSIALQAARTLPLINAVVASEFELNFRTPGSIMRGNCVASKLMGAYSRTYSRRCVVPSASTTTTKRARSPCDCLVRYDDLHLRHPQASCARHISKLASVTW